MAKPTTAEDFRSSFRFFPSHDCGDWICRNIFVCLDRHNCNICHSKSFAIHPFSTWYVCISFIISCAESHRDIYPPADVAVVSRHIFVIPTFWLSCVQPGYRLHLHNYPSWTWISLNGSSSFHHPNLWLMLSRSFLPRQGTKGGSAIIPWSHDISCLGWGVNHSDTESRYLTPTSIEWDLDRYSQWALDGRW